MADTFDPDFREAAREVNGEMTDGAGPVLVLPDHAPLFCDLNASRNQALGPAPPCHAAPPVVPIGLLPVVKNSSGFFITYPVFQRSGAFSKYYL